MEVLALLFLGCGVEALLLIALVLILFLLLSEPKSPPASSPVLVEKPQKEVQVATHQAFVPITGIPLALLPKELNYRPEYEGAVFVGLGKPGKDSYKYGFVCDVDDATGEVVKARYDGLKKFDGPIGPNGHATPSAVMVVAEKRTDGYYLYVAPEYRVFIYDDEADVEGVTIEESFPGGFTEKGKTPEETALDEVLHELGVEVKNAEIKRIGRASDNRAMTETCIRYYLGVFERQVEQALQGDEVVGKTTAVRVDQFEPGLDGIVDTAYSFLVSRKGGLGLVKPM